MTRFWAQGKMIGLDFETTGVDVEQDRIVTASLIVIEPGCHPLTHSFLVDPGVEIPEGASKLHGVTTERARAEGRPPGEVLCQLGELLTEHWVPEVPLVAYNASYDLSLYDHELSRHCGSERLSLAERYVIDPLVIDRHVDRFRKGSRKLEAACRHYGVELTEAHTSDADTLATLRLAYKIAVRYPGDVGSMALPTLHANQREWHRFWSQRMATFLRKDATRMESLWPEAKRGNPNARKFIAEKFARLEITEELTDELIAETVAGTRRKADEFAAGAMCWPVRSAVAVTEV